MRNRIVRLCVIVCYACSLFALPASWPLRRSEAARTCSCPMCHALGGGHCDCCEASKCTCHMSSGEDDDQMIPAQELAVLPNPEEYRVLLSSVPLTLNAPPGILVPELPIPTPPPKA